MAWVITHYYLIALGLACLPEVAHAQESDPDVAIARSCFDNTGGPEACRNVFGWCDFQWGFDRRIRCAEQIAGNWDKVLSSYWVELEPAANAFDTANNRDNVPPVWEAIEAEQLAWKQFRAASCDVNLESEGNITGEEEGRALCMADVTRQRVAKLYAMLGEFRSYANERGQPLP